MKIFYAVQATGNGHISRAITLLPYLEQYGKVDVFLSGNNSNLNPVLPIKYRSKGISLFYNKSGGLDYLKISTQRNPVNVWKEIKELPVGKYDLVINDFDMITSTACQLKNIPSLHFGHQASFQSNLTPRPNSKSWHGELLLRNYVKATRHIGLHFRPYDKDIFGAIVKEEILAATPADKGYIIVYLPSHSKEKLISIFSRLKEQDFIIFSREVKNIERLGNINFYPIDNIKFTNCLINCHGIICGAGFETPAEALHLGKKIIAIPIKGQYEQSCNAAALEDLGVICLTDISVNSIDKIRAGIETARNIQIDYSNTIKESLSYIFEKGVPNTNTHSPVKRISTQDFRDVHLNSSTFA